MGSYRKKFDSGIRSIRKLWEKEFLYLRSNHPAYIMLFITIFLIFYNIGWSQLPPREKEAGNEEQVYGNIRETQHIFVKMMILVPDDVIDIHFSTFSDAVLLTHLDFPDLQFTSDIDEAKTSLKSGDVDIVIQFTTLIETGKRIDYHIISQSGDLNKHYCVNCDQHRKTSWKNAIEAQNVANRFLYWLIKSRGKVLEGPNMKVTSVFVTEEEADDMYTKRQTDLLVLWLILLPLCFRFIDSWNDDRKSGFYKTMLELGTGHIVYFIAKFQFWYIFALIVTILVCIVNISVISHSWSATYIPFMVIYSGCIMCFALFLSTLFVDATLIAKCVLLMLMAVGEFGIGGKYFGIAFFQLSIRFFGKSFGEDRHWEDAISLVCMFVNFWIMMGVSWYLDVFHFSLTLEPLQFYFPLAQSYWRPKQRVGRPDSDFSKQLLFPHNTPPPPPPPQPPVTKSKETTTKTTENGVTGSVPDAPGIPLVALHSVCKRVNNNWRVNQLTLTIKSGEILTLYGHRGCGSYEILSMISGHSHPDYGEVRREHTARNLIYSVASEVPKLGYLTAKEYLKIVSGMRGFDLKSSDLRELLKQLDLHKVRKLPLNLLSTTQKERLRIAAAFVGHPDVVVIDWPTKQSLPHYKFQILRFIEKMKQKKAIVIASYDAEGTEAISDRVLLLSEGYVIFNGACETYMESMSSVFEVRLWPINGFSGDNIRGILNTLTMDDVKIKEMAKWFETPNGKLRVTFPIIYRKSIAMCLQELEKSMLNFGIAFYELATPNIHDAYSFACHDEKQYEPLTSFDANFEFFNSQKKISRTKALLKNLLRIFKDVRFLVQSIGVIVLFVVLVSISTVLFRLTGGGHSHTLDIALNAHDSPITIYCNDCVKENFKNVKYSPFTNIKTSLIENEAQIFWRNTSGKIADEMMTVSKGDDSFTMIIQNFAISQMIHKITGNYPKITPHLESEQFRANSAENGMSMVFNDIDRNQVAMVLAESSKLMFLLGVTQTFMYILAVILPMRLLKVNMTPNSLLFPWPRYLYFGFIFVGNLLIFLVLASISTGLFMIFGYFPVNRASCYFRFLMCWTAAFCGTLPLLYGLVFSVNNTSAIIPTVITISTILVSLPNMIKALSEENWISLENLVRLISWTCVFSPPTTIQVFAAFLDAEGDYHAENSGTILALTLLSFAHLWTLGAFALAVVQPGFGMIRQFWFRITVNLFSFFHKGTTLHPAASINNSFMFNRGEILSTSSEKRSSGGKEEGIQKTSISDGTSTGEKKSPTRKKESKELYGPKNSKESKNSKEFKKSKELKNSEERKGSKELKNSKEPKNSEEPKDSKKPKNSKESKNSNEFKESKELKGSKEPKSSEKPTNSAERKLSKEFKNSKEPNEPPHNPFTSKKEPTELKFCEPVSIITNYEEELVLKTVSMKRWNTKQEVAIDKSTMYLLGDHSDIKTAIFQNFAESCPSENIGYVPVVECLPTIYTPRQLLVNVAACHGVSITFKFLEDLLKTFDLMEFAEKSIELLTDADRKILMLISKIILKPSILLFDQLDIYLPHRRMMTVWALCARLRNEGVGVVFTSLQNSFAEDTATSCALVHKGSILVAEAANAVKAERRCLIIDVVPSPEVRIETLTKILEMSLIEAVEMPTTGSRVSIRLMSDDLVTLDMILKFLSMIQKSVVRASIRSASFDEYVSCAFEKKMSKKEDVSPPNPTSPTIPAPDPQAPQKN